ncbi:MAG: circadian clock protein KaiC [Gemmataceae bacterium]|nr:circadian clock protein KaiC [Gemmataceae bacterium]
MSTTAIAEGRAIMRKYPTGIDGFDEISLGGLPEERLTLVLGSPGSGKTVFALQTLVNNARTAGRPGIFIAFEERSELIVANAASFGWDLPALQREKLFFLDALVPSDIATAGDFDLLGLLSGIAAKAREMGARHVVFDAVDVLLTLLANPDRERQELFRLHEWSVEHGLTCMLTAKTLDQDPLAAMSYSFLPFMVDAVVLLRSRMEDRVALRELRVLKYRGSAFAGNAFPYCIDSTGIEVAGTSQGQSRHPVSQERVSTGIARLDAMLGGGYYRGSSVLLSGSPGTAKTSLAGAFAAAACQREERVLYVSFDEVGEEIVRNLASVAIHLGPYVRAGLLHMHAAQTDDMSADEHLLTIRSLIRQRNPRHLIIDPVSAMLKAGGVVAALGVTQRLVRLAKSSGITVLVTSLLDPTDRSLESTPIHVSTLADTWTHLSYLAQGGERNRALTVVKSRGTKHSNQVRELILSDEGITLADVYMAGGEVLMGTARWEKEAAEQLKATRGRADIERRKRELKSAEVEALARRVAAEHAAEASREDLALLEQEKEVWQRRVAEKQQELKHRRSADCTENGASHSSPESAAE